MYCVIQFYVQLREPLAEHRPFLKVLAIKLVIFLSFWQSSAISVGTSTLNLVHATDAIAYPDIKVGIPALLLCFEMAIFAILHLWAFPYGPYVPGAKATFYPAPDARRPEILPPRENVHAAPAGGFLGILALWDAMNVWDFVKAFGRGMRWLFCGIKRRREDISYRNKRQNTGLNMDDLRSKNFSPPYDDDDSYRKSENSTRRNTEHLPIAHEFRRSNYGYPVGIYPGSNLRPIDENAGLINHAQPNPMTAVAVSPRLDRHPALMSPYQDQKFDDAPDTPTAGQSATPRPAGRLPYNEYEEEARRAAERNGNRTHGQTNIGRALWGQSPRTDNR
jgi:hypothetical protein